MKNKMAVALSQSLFPSQRTQSSSATPPTESVTELLTHCLAGDQQAWADLILQYQWFVYAIPRRSRISPQDSEDISQLVFNALYQNLSKITDEHHLRSWLGKTAKAKSIDFLRRKDNQVAPFEDSPALDLELERTEQQDIIRKAIASIKNEKYRNLVCLTLEREGISIQELSHLSNVPLNSLVTTKARALDEFKIALNKGGWRW